MFGFVLRENRTKEERVLNEAQAFHWSDKHNVSVTESAQKRIDETMTLNQSFKFRRGW